MIGAHPPPKPDTAEGYQPATEGRLGLRSLRSLASRAMKVRTIGTGLTTKRQRTRRPAPGHDPVKTAGGSDQSASGHPKSDSVAPPEPATASVHPTPPLDPHDGARPPQTIEQLLLGIADSDQLSFAALYDHMAPAVYGLSLAMLRGQQKAEQCTEEVFVQLWRQATTFDPTAGTARAWIAAVAHRHAVTVLRTDQTTHGPAPSNRRHGTDNVLAALDETQRAPIELAYFDGMTCPGIAEITGVAEPTVRARIRDGLTALGSHTNDREPWSGAPPDVLTGTLAEQIRDGYQTRIGIERDKGRLAQRSGKLADRQGSETTIL